jgi:hypothetical protein
MVEVNERPVTAVTADSLENENVSSLLCPNCQHLIPTAAYSLHTLRCARVRWHCEECGAGMSPGQRQVHISLLHFESICCQCNQHVARWKMQSHRQDLCLHRPVACIYCAMNISLIDRGPHQEECGLQGATCHYCMFNSKRKFMLTHLMREHHIGKPTFNDYR